MTALTQRFTLPEDIASKLPSRMIRIRKANGLTQATVAKRLQITNGSYGHYERGFRKVSLDMIPRLAEALECSESELLGIEKQRTKRGPVSRFEQINEKLVKLPRNKQQVILNMIEGAIEREAS